METLAAPVMLIGKQLPGQADSGIADVEMIGSAPICIVPDVGLLIQFSSDAVKE
jgi:hypothetical protein